MIVKKLAVPLINDKILLQAERCYIACGGISEEAFAFVTGRLSIKCKIEIVTGLDLPTSPLVMKKVIKQLTDRVSLRIYTKNFFHPCVYIFDLPFRKSVAFIGSGHFTMEGLKDNEEIFYKITDQKEIENLKSWFTGYNEFSEQLTEALVMEYELVYPSLKQREIFSRQEKKEVFELTTRGFNWDNIKFKNQFFKREDYVIFCNNVASLHNLESLAARNIVQTKLLQLHDGLKPQLANLKLFSDKNGMASSHDPVNFANGKIRSMRLSYGRSESELQRYRADAKPCDFITLQVAIRQIEVSILLIAGLENSGREDREYFFAQMQAPEYRTMFFKLLTGLTSEYWIEIAGERRGTDTFQNEEMLWYFTNADDYRYYPFKIGRNYAPGDLEISQDNIVSTISKEFDKLVLLYRHIKAPK